MDRSRLNLTESRVRNIPSIDNSVMNAVLIIEAYNMDKSELIAGMTADSADTENALRIPRSD